ncbi:hypothetical protein EYF80_035065 [Liparis tanakae]|uniref:Uncharacterized protein n=1 Tax=Liparis tanakae TaxID=230148 RepID=A0A4Z2GPU4_9TELE|nr:hypothetical protein EYF80_035065 [Liparis tanakae]
MGNRQPGVGRAPALCGDMSLEDVGSTASLGAESNTSDHYDGHRLSPGQDQDLDNHSQGQDGIVMERIAALSLDMFEPSDFTGRFTKIQSKFRKRTRIFGDSRNIRITGCPPASLSPSPPLSERTPLFSHSLRPQRLILPSGPSAACHRGDIASAAMATSQQDSGFFDISIKSLLKSLGGSEYSNHITVVDASASRDLHEEQTLLNCC